MRKLMYFDATELNEVSPNHRQLELFSAASDLKISKLNLKQQYAFLNKDYMAFINAKKATINKVDIDTLDQLFIGKLNALVSTVETELLNGADLSLLLGITVKGLKTAATKFGKEYRKMLQVRDSMSYIPKDIQLRVDKTYKIFIAEQRKIVFAPVLNLFSDFDEELLNKDETIDEETKQILINGNPDLDGLREMIVGTFRDENMDVDAELLNKIVTNVYENYKVN